VIEYEAKTAFEFDTADCRLHFLPAGEVRHGNEARQEVIVLAVKNSDINAYLQWLDACGAVVEALDVEPCALYRSVERFIRRREDEQDVNIIVDVGVQRSQVVIGRGRDISFMKVIDVGGRNFNDAVSRKLGISLEEAMQLRRRLCDPAQQADPAARRDPVRQAAIDATRATMEELGREISLCLRYHSVTFRGQRPTRLRLCGGEANDSQLQTLLNSALTVPVEVARPLLSVDASRMKPADRRGAMCEWTLAFGLALRRVEGTFGPRNGKPRTGPAPLTPPPEVEPQAEAGSAVSPGAGPRGAAARGDLTAGAAPRPARAEVSHA
jgi:type IV pilus assembly protein PilM